MYPRITKAIKILLITYFVLFLIERTAAKFFGAELIYYVGLVPSLVVFKFWIWQIFTYAFFHVDLMHLFLNLLMLAFFGGDLNQLWGTRAFLRYYFFCSIFAGFCFLLMQFFVSAIHTPMVGASGGIFGLLVAYGIVFSERTILAFLMFPMKVKHFIWIAAAAEFMAMVFGSNSNVSNVAHLGGMAGGFGYLWVTAYMKTRKKKDSPGFFERRKREKARSHLKLVKSDREGSDDGPGNQGNGPTWH